MIDLIDLNSSKSLDVGRLRQVRSSAEWGQETGAADEYVLSGFQSLHFCLEPAEI